MRPAARRTAAEREADLRLHAASSASVANRSCTSQSVTVTVGEVADFEVVAVGDVDEAVDLRRIGARAGDGAFLVDVVNQHLDGPADALLQRRVLMSS